ncbi:ABC transporter substrate-binding protein [Trueperella bialowiezensis]|uniref:Maltose-binding periplasmic proteins/domains n=1 Tax=Trueperella bialowiezensis TaxID=312285 RepID=A0A448PF13_9ACTO|nr:ABC transporter substrate-binding protein [Trueperella bialowiezensis]VEI13500.1 Maltose-binding periplasmic proteins/domains [Trueperella bialowiezensis]
MTSSIFKRAIALVVPLAMLTACAGGGGSEDGGNTADGGGVDSVKSQVDEDFDLDALVEAAKAEGPITIYDNSSAVEDMAAAFTEKYGIQATGVKVDSAEVLEMVTREAESGNVQGDVIAIQDLPALANNLIPAGHVYSWIPGDLVDDIESTQRDPLIMINDPNFWSYNTEVYDTCPVDNVWAFTDEEWNGKISIEDPAGANKILDWFSEMDQFLQDDMKAAYKDHYGKDYEGENAVRDWVEGLAGNNPILTDSNEDISAAVGSPGQTEPPMGLMASSKFRNVEEKGYHQGVCEGIEPFVGIAAPKPIVIASNTKNPNAAKLFVHFAMTEEGIAPQIGDGKYSSNTAITQPEDPSNAAKHRENVFFFDNAGADTDWKTRQDWQDFWRLSAK